MISETRKAWIAFLLGFLGPIGVLLASDAELSVRSVLAALVAGLITGLGTFFVPNAAPKGQPLTDDGAEGPKS